MNKDIFDEIVLKKNISGINGHRSVGGYRASIYNALSLESVETLVDAMKQFEKIYNMKILANDGISDSGVEELRKSGFEVITTNVAQEQPKLHKH